MTKHGSLPHSYSDGVGFNPSTLYDVPASARGALHPDPHSVYDIPKGALIASGHYKVPPLAQSVPLEGVYDVPPSSRAIYDVPPNVQHAYHAPGSELYDVPPFGTRPRLNSQPTSQEELLAARRSVTDTVLPAGGGGIDYSHYDVPRHLLISQPNMNHQQRHYQQPNKRLSRRNSYSPSQTRGSLVYDVPPDARGPPTAAKPNKKRTPPSRSHSTSSPPNIASPERRQQWPNEVLYDVPPLDPEFLAQHDVKHHRHTNSTSSESDTSHLTKNAASATPTLQGHHIGRAESAKRGRAPPPTKKKPGQRGEGVKM